MPNRPKETSTSNKEKMTKSPPTPYFLYYYAITVSLGFYPRGPVRLAVRMVTSMIAFAILKAYDHALFQLPLCMCKKAFFYEVCSNTCSNTLVCVQALHARMCWRRWCPLSWTTLRPSKSSLSRA